MNAWREGFAIGIACGYMAATDGPWWKQLEAGAGAFVGAILVLAIWEFVSGWLRRRRQAA